MYNTDHHGKKVLHVYFVNFHEDCCTRMRLTTRQDKRPTEVESNLKAPLSLASAVTYSRGGRQPNPKCTFVFSRLLQTTR